MKYCCNCGKQLKDESKYCDACGAEQSRIAVRNEESCGKSESRFHPHCPKCKSANVVPVLASQTTEGRSITSIDISSSGHSALGLGWLGAITKNKYGWLCQNCGMQFPNIHDIEKQVSLHSSGFELVRVLIILSAICAVIFAVMQQWIYMQICLACIVLYALAWAYSKKKLENLQAELEFWKYSCYDHE